MNNDKKFTKLVLHISDELNEKLTEASAKQKLSIGSVIRKALEQYLENPERKDK
jgi:predicted HicB family RNase H-like nuclease